MAAGSLPLHAVSLPVATGGWVFAATRKVSLAVANGGWVFAAAHKVSLAVASGGWVFPAARSFSSCGQWGLLSSCSVRISHCGGFPCNCSFGNCSWWRAQKFWHVGLVARRHVEPSWTRNQIHVHCIGGQILHHWTTREVLERNY